MRDSLRFVDGVRRGIGRGRKGLSCQQRLLDGDFSRRLGKVIQVHRVVANDGHVLEGIIELADVAGVVVIEQEILAALDSFGLCTHAPF